MVTFIPAAAPARMAECGTAIGNPLTCGAQVSTNRLPCGGPSFSTSVIWSANPWQGCSTADSRLMTGTPA